MKITYLVPGLLDVRGGVKRIVEYATHLAARGHDVEILCEEMEQPKWLPKEIYHGFRLSSFRGYSSLETDVAIATGGRSARRLARMVNAKIKVYSVVMQESLNKPTFKRDMTIDRDQYLRDCYSQKWVYIANSSWLKNLVENSFGQKCHLIHGGVNENILQPIDGLRDDKVMHCLVYGRSDGWKGGARSARAAELANIELGNVRLISYGQSKGPITALPLQHHRIPDQSSLATIYSSAHVFLQSSRFEGFCNTAFEAMACGTPVISTKVNGIEDFCIDEETAILVPVDDEPAMADAIIRLSRDKQLWNKLRNNGLEMAKKFDWDTEMAKMEIILGDALRCSGR